MSRRHPKRLTSKQSASDSHQSKRHRSNHQRRGQRPRVNLREERLRRGYSIEDIAERARIPMRVIEALETGDVTGVQKGPLLLGYKRQYLRLLRLPENAKLIFRQPGLGESLGRELGQRLKTLTKTNTTTSHFPAPNLAKLTASSVLITAAIILGLKGVSNVIDPPKTVESTPIAVETQEESTSLLTTLSDIFTRSEPVPEKKEASLPRFGIRPLSNVSVKITVDGQVAHKGIMKSARKFKKFEFEKRLEFWTEDMSSLKLSYNDRLIQPQGDISGSRKLVFAIDKSDL